MSGAAKVISGESYTLLSEREKVNECRLWAIKSRSKPAYCTFLELNDDLLNVDCSTHLTTIAFFPFGNTRPISTAETPLLCKAFASLSASSPATEINNPPAVCGS